MRTHKVTHGLVKSCGCYSRKLASERLLGKAGIHSSPVGVGGLNKLFADYKKTAKRGVRPFELTLELFQKLTSSNCHYCGNPPSLLSYHKGAKHLAYKYNGVDRVNSGLGYIESNCVSCCSNCNYGKRTLSAQEYVEHCRRVVAHNGEKS